MNEEGNPFKIVLDSIFDIINVNKIPKIIMHSTANVAVNDLSAPVK